LAAQQVAPAGTLTQLPFVLPAPITHNLYMGKSCFFFSLDAGELLYLFNKINGEKETDAF